MIRPPEWMARAECAQLDDPELFFPGKGEHVAGQAARAVCGRCPVRQQCLEEALGSHLTGIWGGTSAVERAQMRRDAKAAA